MLPRLLGRFELPKLGKIEKAKVSDFGESRRLFCLPLIPQFSQKDLGDDLKNAINQFWEQVASQLENLEKIGRVSHVFIESLTKGGESGLDMLKQLGKESFRLVKEKVDKGADLVVVEEEEVLNEFLEWSLCLSVIRRSEKVLTKVLGFLQEVKERRNRGIAEKINQSLMGNDCGLLIMTDENRLQVQPLLSPDIQIFLIHPPAFNDVMQCFREYLREKSQKL